MGRAKGKGRKENKKPFIARFSMGESDDRRHVSVTVTLETKVGVIKRRLAAADQTLRADRLVLFSAGNQLDDDEKTLADYEDITRNSLFSLLTRVHLLVVKLDGSVLRLKAPARNRVKHTKDAIERHDSDLPAAKMVLVHKGVVLRNDDSLSETGVTDGSHLVCLVRRPEQEQYEARRWWKMARRLCDACGKQGRISKPTFPRCSLCSKRRYCDENCQRADWEAGHQDFCVGRIEELERLVARRNNEVARRVAQQDRGRVPDLMSELGDLDEVPDQFGPW